MVDVTGVNKYKGVRLPMHQQLSDENMVEMDNAFKYVEDKYGNVFDELEGNLKVIRVERIEDIIEGQKCHRRGGDYKDDEKAIIINLIYFGREAKEENKKIANEVFGGFKKEFMYRMGQYLFYRKNLGRQTTIIYNNNKEYFNKHYDSPDIRNLKGVKKKLCDMFAKCFYDCYNGTLDKKISDEIDKLF
jgi:hypothetical protein